jgi:hypothetical protein
MSPFSEEIAIEIEELEDIPTELEPGPKSDQEIEDAYANISFRVIYQSNNFFLPQIQSLVHGREVLNLRPEYQRRSRWNNIKKSQLIESLLLNIPIPPVYLYESEAARYEVMDGQQRLNAVYDFLENDFTLIGMEKLDFLNGRRFNRLPPKLRRGLERSSISAIVLLQETKSDASDPYLVRRYVFERLNTGGEKLNAQEIRNSIYRGPFNDLIVELTRNPTFCKFFEIPPYTAVDDNDAYENPDRKRNRLYQSMGDCALVLRFFALQDDRDIRGAMSVILDRCMEKHKGVGALDIEADRAVFTRVMAACDAIFGDKAFRLPPDKGGNQRVSAALYDAIAVSLARRRGSIDRLVEMADEIKGKVADLVQADPELVTAKANTSGSIKHRLATVGGILDSVL